MSHGLPAHPLQGLTSSLGQTLSPFQTLDHDQSRTLDHDQSRTLADGQTPQQALTPAWTPNLTP